VNPIDFALDEYLRSAKGPDRAFARDFRAIPLYRGWTGTIFLTTSGEFLFREEERDPPSVTAENDQGMQVLALACGTEQFPILSNLLPARTMDRQDCTTCNGTGRVWPRNITSWLYCNECHGLGWSGDLHHPLPVHELGSERASYLSFDDAVVKFLRFAAGQGIYGNPVFIRASDSFLVRGKILVRVREQAEARSHTLRAYNQAARRRLGVLISAAAVLPKNRLAIYVYGPADSDEAERLMFHDGLKLSVPQTIRRGMAIGPPAQFVLRKLQRYASIVQSGVQRLK